MEEVVAGHDVELADSHPPEFQDDDVSQVSYRFNDRLREHSSRPRKPRYGASDTARETAMSVALYTLPTISNLRNRAQVTQADIAKEFSLLDIEGDGKLTFLRVKSALKLLVGNSTSDYAERDFTGTDHDDVLIRSWLRDNDPDTKGYVDWDDFLRIYISANKVAIPGNKSNRPPGEGDSFRMKAGSSYRRSLGGTGSGAVAADTTSRMMKLQK